MRDSVNKYEYILNDKEILNYESWLNTLDKKLILLPPEFRFQTNGIGTTVTVVYG